MLLSGISAKAQLPDVAFVKIESNSPLRFAAPEAPIGIDSLGVRITGALPTPIELKIYGLTPDDSGSPGNQVREILSVRAADLKTHNLNGTATEIVYSLAGVKTDSVIELIARLTDADGNSLGRVSHFTLDKAGSLQNSPSLLARAAAIAPGFLLRLSHLYDSVREEADARSIYIVNIANGKPMSQPKKMDVPPAMLQGLTLSHSGAVIAWVASSGGSFDLWTSPIAADGAHVVGAQSILHSENPLITPFFVDEDRIIVVSGSSLLLVSRAQPKDARTVQLESLPVTRLFQVTANEDAIDCVIEVARDGPGLVTHYDVRISKQGKVVSLNRLPENPYYNAYAVSVEGLPIFFAGAAEDGDAIQYLTLDNSVIPFFPCHQPGLVTVAASGSRVAFAASN